VSLKAGGVGLNSDGRRICVPARSLVEPGGRGPGDRPRHRIGQTKPVFAYRLIAADTVEEKVLALQQSKRELADAILNADNSLISKLGREDLELLLS
jgi:SNF2 family DNA or RNA helicase